MDSPDEPKFLQADATSLFSLKAELERKREAFKQAKLQQVSKPLTKRTAFFKKIHKNDNKSATVVTSNIDASYEDEIALKKSRMALEAKASLYENIVSKHLVIDEENETYLVDFQRKLLHPENNTSDNSDVVSQNNNVYFDEKSNTETDIHIPLNQNSSFKEFNSDWKEPNKSTDKSAAMPDKDEPVHYQNVQFNEIRDHGVGYFAFSTDEEKRKQQLDELKNLHKDANKKRSAWEHMQQTKKLKLQSRLEKICQRRNIDTGVIKEILTKNDPESDTNDGCQKNSSTSVLDNTVTLNDIPLPEDPPAFSKPVKIRPWDIGKIGNDFQSPQNYKFDQKQWIENRESERNPEFAPPTTY